MHAPAGAGGGGSCPVLPASRANALAARPPNSVRLDGPPEHDDGEQPQREQQAHPEHRPERLPLRRHRIVDAPLGVHPFLDPDQHAVDERGEEHGAAGADRLRDLAACPDDGERFEELPGGGCGGDPGERRVRRSRRHNDRRGEAVIAAHFAAPCPSEL